MEKREFSRSPVAVEVDVTGDDFQITVREIRNVSMGGVGIAPCDEEIPVGCECRVRLYLGGRLSGVCIEAEGRVARADDEEIGIEFTEIIGADSYQHLKRLVLLNSEDPRAVQEEFGAHLGIKSAE